MAPNALGRLFATCDPEKWGIGHEENCARHRDICCAQRLGHRRRQITLRRASLSPGKDCAPAQKRFSELRLCAMISAKLRLKSDLWAEKISNGAFTNTCR
jgi:hypothetical protein